MIVLYGSAGIVLSGVLCVSDVVRTDQDAPAYTRTIFVFKLCLQLSMGLFIFLVWITDVDFKRIIHGICNTLARVCPCFQRIATWVAGTVMDRSTSRIPFVPPNTW
mmetsp:Transcript_36676/g.71122  ORF Transcript_36676/g.71122 Transcript_36676/m.71122 type:complete len:106 (+) Transcript_36676:2-319(+)